MKSTLLYLSILTTLWSCSGNKNHEHQTIQYEEVNLSLQDISAHLPKELSITDSKVDTLWSDDLECQAIRLTISTKAEKGFLKSLAQNNSYIIEATCSGEQARSFTTGTLFDKDSPRPYHLHSSFVIYNEQDRRFIFEFPFRALEMPEGNQKIKFQLNFYPAYFKINASNKQEGYFEKKDKKSAGNWEAQTYVYAPLLEQISFEIRHVSLDNTKKDPQTYDIRYAGPGYPDLYWQLDCGGEKIYTSPVATNVTKITKTYSTEEFYCTQKDVIEIGVYDYDKASKPDIVEIIKLPITGLIARNGKINNNGNLKEFHFTIKNKAR